MAFSKAFLEEVKHRTSLPDLISRFVQLKRAGSNLVGRCPFHNEKTPSFTVFPATESYYCFGCGAGGDAITFVMQAEGLDYREAVEELASAAGVPLEEDTFRRDEPSAPRVRKDRLIEISTAAARFFRDRLYAPEGREALTYLLERRRFTETTIRRFGIGYAPNSWSALRDHLYGQGYTDTEITLAGLGKTGKTGKPYDVFRHRVIFPIFSLTGEVIAFSGRRLDDTDQRAQKYYNTENSPLFKKSRILFGMNFAKNEAEKGFILCEGAPDCVAMHQAGFGNAVATLGTAITGEHARLVSRYTKTVYLAYDNDGAGRGATLRGIDLLEQVGVKTRILTLDDKETKDPDEYIKAHGEKAFQTRVDASQGQVDYRIGEILSRYKLEEPDDRLRCAGELTAYIASLESRMEREVYASRAAERLSLTAESLKDEVERQHKTLLARNRKQEATRAVQKAAGYGDTVNPDKLRYSSASPHEEAILGILLLHPEFGKTASSMLAPEDFATAFNRKLWELFSPAFAAGEDPDLTADGTLNVREAGTAEGYRAARVTLGGNTEETLHGHIRALKTLREKQAYEKKIEQDPAVALREYLETLRGRKEQD